MDERTRGMRVLCAVYRDLGIPGTDTSSKRVEIREDEERCYSKERIANQETDVSRVILSLPCLTVPRWETTLFRERRNFLQSWRPANFHRQINARFTRCYANRIYVFVS